MYKTAVANFLGLDTVLANVGSLQDKRFVEGHECIKFGYGYHHPKNTLLARLPWHYTVQSGIFVTTTQFKAK